MGRMKMKLSVLNISAISFILGCIIYSVINYTELSKEEGWGIVAMIGLLGIGILLMAMDLLLQRFFANRWVNNTIGIIILLFTVLYIFKK